MTVLRVFGRNYAKAERSLYDSASDEGLLHLVEVFERTPVITGAGSAGAGAFAAPAADTGTFIDVSYDAAPYTGCGEYWIMDNEDLDVVAELGWAFQCLDAVGVDPEFE